MPNRHRKMSKAQLIVGITILLVIVIYNHFLYDVRPRPQVIQSTLTDHQKESLRILGEMTKLLITMATAVFGVVAFFVTEQYRKGKSLSAPSWRDAVLAFASAGLSVDFGYVLMEKWVELLANGMFAPFERLVTTPQTLQFSAFLVSLVFLARLALRETEG
jgi:hypothetical protein